MDESKNLLSKNRDIILNRAKAYYENNKEILRERAKSRYRELSADEKDLKKQYQKDRYNNMTFEDKQKHKEYQRKNGEAKKQQRNYIDIFIKNNGEEYEKFMNNINKQGNL